MLVRIRIVHTANLWDPVHFFNNLIGDFCLVKNRKIHRFNRDIVCFLLRFGEFEVGDLPCPAVSGGKTTKLPRL